MIINIKYNTKNISIRSMIYYTFHQYHRWRKLQKICSLDLYLLNLFWWLMSISTTKSNTIILTLALSGLAGSLPKPETVKVEKVERVRRITILDPTRTITRVNKINKKKKPSSFHHQWSRHPQDRNYLQKQRPGTKYKKKKRSC